MNKIFLAAIVIFSGMSASLPVMAVTPDNVIEKSNENPFARTIIVKHENGSIGHREIGVNNLSSDEVIIVQKPGDRPDRPGRGGDDFARRAQIQSFMLGKIIGYLSLSEDQVSSFTPVFKNYSNQREEIIGERRKLMKYITQNVDNSNVPVKDLESKVIKLRKTNQSLQNEREKFLESTKKLLSDRQYVKLVIFEDWLKEDYFRHMRDGEKPSETK